MASAADEWGEMSRTFGLYLTASRVVPVLLPVNCFFAAVRFASEGAALSVPFYLLVSALLAGASVVLYVLTKAEAASAGTHGDTAEAPPADRWEQATARLRRSVWTVAAAFLLGGAVGWVL